MLEVPAATAVASPDVLTVTAAGWLLVHVKVSPETAAPLESTAVAVNCCVLPAPLRTVVPCGDICRLVMAHSAKVAGTPLTGFTVFAETLTCVMPGRTAFTLLVVAVLPEVKKLAGVPTVVLAMFQLKAPTLAV